MDIDQLKHKLRELKKLEERIRFGNESIPHANKYVWDAYFCTKSFNELTVKYPLWKLAKFDKLELKEVFEEYFYSIYIQKYKESGLDFDDIYDPVFLSVFGLHPGASVDDVKRKFRELAKKYHPDHGGDKDKMMDLLDAYHRLLKRK
jgi:DnaJ-domain-containing protein 1